MAATNSTILILTWASTRQCTVKISAHVLTFLLCRPSLEAQKEGWQRVSRRAAGGRTGWKGRKGQEGGRKWADLWVVQPKMGVERGGLGSPDSAAQSRAADFSCACCTLPGKEEYFPIPLGNVSPHPSPRLDKGQVGRAPFVSGPTYKISRGSNNFSSH